MQPEQLSPPHTQSTFSEHLLDTKAIIGDDLSIWKEEEGREGEKEKEKEGSSERESQPGNRD